jgi:hypothetical protein
MHPIRFTHRTFLFHLLFWVLYCISNAFLWQTFDKNYNETTYYGLTRLPLKIVTVYVNFFLLGQFFFKKKYVAFSVFFLLNLFLAGFIQTYISTSGIFNYQLFTQYSLPICSVVLFSSIFIVIHQFFVQAKES